VTASEPHERGRLRSKPIRETRKKRLVAGAGASGTRRKPVLRGRRDDSINHAAEGDGMGGGGLIRRGTRDPRGGRFRHDPDLLVIVIRPRKGAGSYYLRRFSDYSDYVIGDDALKNLGSGEDVPGGD